MMDSSKVLMLISTIALYKALRFITASLHASSPVATTSNNAIPISTVDSSSDIVHFPKLKIIDVSYSDHLISLPYLSQAPNIEEVWAIGCENLVQIHSPTVLPKLEDICSNYSEKLRCVSIGRKMNGSVGLVAVYKGFDLLNLSFNKLTIKLFISDDHEGICGVQFKVVSVPFTNIENGGAIKLAGQSLRSLLPFVRIVRWEDMSESENFKNRFGTCQFSSELDNYNLERTVSLSSIAFWIWWMSEFPTRAHPHLNFLHKNFDLSLLGIESQPISKHSQTINLRSNTRCRFDQSLEVERSSKDLSAFWRKWMDSMLWSLSTAMMRTFRVLPPNVAISSLRVLKWTDFRISMRSSIRLERSS
ncbi:TMV resistance protein N-like [Senna tora]|uniref:TMV resistance protein N-like n=1 Tax=Senna tora TaxID=362788 RepID=A0A835CGS1_9FABA|nr:TMV resistance protein N-like [Senna tora]